MKITLILIIVCCFCYSHSSGQNSKYHFAKRVFKSKYKKSQLATFDGKVIAFDSNTFQFGDKVLTVETEDSSLLTIFTQGVFHPDIIGGKGTIKALSTTQLDTMSSSDQFFYNMSRNDSIRIGALEELDRLNPDFKTKRFVFWWFRRGSANPTECYFELYNPRATRKMTLKAFVSGSRLTFFHKGTIII